MPRRITINSKSTGKFEKRVINGREHIVTSMVSIVGDSVMNRLAYPFDQVVNSFQQLDNLHAPAGHPVIDGTNSSAFLPLAVNAHNIGGIVLSPKMEGRNVINELAFDIEIANKDERGKEAIRRIEAGEAIGVSTGLNAEIDKQAGMMGNVAFDGIVSNIKFDHVAVLLNEAPAGDETFTINSSDVMICNLAESVGELEDKVWQAVKARFGDNSWPSEILLNPESVIVRTDETLISIKFGYNDDGDVVFTGEPIPVERKVTFEPIAINQRVDEMDLAKFVLALIANSANGFTMADEPRLMAMSETGLVAVLSNAKEFTVEDATALIEAKGLHVNKFTSADVAAFELAKPQLELLATNAQKERDLMSAALIANSEFTQAECDNMDILALEKMAKSVTSTQDFSLQNAETTKATNSKGCKLAENS